MNMPQKDYEELRREILAYATSAPSGFGKRGLQDYWNAFAVVMSKRDDRELGSGFRHIYNVLNLDDSHIETALQRIFSDYEITQEERAQYIADRIADDKPESDPMRSEREILLDLVAILESPHTSVNIRWECGKQYEKTLQEAKEVLRTRKPE